MHYGCLHIVSIHFLFLICFLSDLIVSKQHNPFDGPFSNSVPFSFPLDAYTATILPDIGPNQYVYATEPRLGVPEPFNGQPTGTVSFSILEKNDINGLFSSETVKHGGFYFLRLRTTYNAEFNTKKRSIYSFHVKAVFRSQQVNNRPPIYLSNKTHVTINILNRNDNCPFFSRDSFEWSVLENATTFTEVGRVSATDADSGINNQIYYFLQPGRNMVPFRIDSRTGAIYPTQSIAIRRNDTTKIEGSTYLSMFHGLKEYTFKVNARHRGNLSHVSCVFVSHAQVKLKIIPVRPSEPKISVVLLNKIEQPGSAGTDYAEIHVDSLAKSKNLKLLILEPEAASIFQLVRVGLQPTWLLRLKSQYSDLSLLSKAKLTLEVTDSEYASSEIIPSSARHSFEVSLLPRSLFKIILPTEIHITVSEMAILHSTVYIINPLVNFYIHNSSFLFTQQVKNYDMPIAVTETGAVVVMNSIDLESLGDDRLEIPFTVADRNNILLSSMADSKLVVHITDYNELDPIISDSGLEHSIVESLSVGSEVLHIEARDPDFSNTRLSFTLFDEERFPFNFSTSKPGTLLLSSALDAETMPAEFHIKVKVSDSGLPYPRSVIVIRVIRILDVNEFSPVFVEKSCDAQLSVASSGEIIPFPSGGFELGRFFAEDLDRDGGSGVQIRLASSTVSESCFNVERKTGLLVLNCSIIGPPGSSVTVYLEASDRTRFSENPFKLKIQLVESNLGRTFSKTCQPSGIYKKVWEQKQKRIEYESSLAGLTSIDSLFTKRPQVSVPSLTIPTELKIPENLPLGTTVLTFSAKCNSPPDGEGVHRLIYGVEALETRLASGGMVYPPYQAFVLGDINYASDVTADAFMSLHVQAPVDRETFSAFDLTIHVCIVDSSPPSCSASNLTIDIEDILDVPPRFTDKQTESLAFSLSENEVEGTVIGQISGDGVDEKLKFRYSLVNFKDTFKIQRRTGRISLKKRLDREILDSYLVMAKVRDTSELPSPSNPHLHALAIAATPDWALVRTATTYFRVNILDINDNIPEFIGRYDNIVLPDDLPPGSYVTTLRARDAETDNNGVLEYSLFGPEADKACFDCNLLTGVVRVSGECGGLRARHTYALTAWVRDLGRPEPRQISTEFRVRVLGLRVNVYPPRFDVTDGIYLGRIREGASVGSRVMRTEEQDALQEDGSASLQVKALDPEGWPIVYKVVGGSGLGRFGVTRDGFIYSTSKLDRESSPFSGGFWLEVSADEEVMEEEEDALTASDGNPPRRSVAEVFVQIEDENDHRPMPSAPEYRLSVPEGTPAGSIIATITGNDGDATGGQLHHAIVSGDPAGYFIINPSTGQTATSDKPIDRESSLLDAGLHPVEEIRLTIELTDSGNPPRSTRVQATVHIDDINDNAPHFLFTSNGEDCSMKDPISVGECYHFYHQLGSLPGSISNGGFCVGRVFAMDPDAGVNGTVTYESTSGGGTNGTDSTRFYVDPITGQICSSEHWDDEMPAGSRVPIKSVIWVTARDNGSPPLHAERAIPVFVSILRADEKPPGLKPAGNIEFVISPPAELKTSPRTLPGTVLYELEIAPGNPVPTGRWNFGLIGVSTTSPFAIASLSPHRAVLYLHDRLNATEAGAIHEVNVIAFAGEGLIAARRTNIVIEQMPEEPPILEVSGITCGPHSTLNITDYRSVIEKSGASGVVIHSTIDESTLVGSVICRLSHGTTSSESVYFEILAFGDDATADLFDLSKETGVLRIAKPLDYEMAREHHILLAMMLASNPDAKAYVGVVVHVTDVNEFPPQFVTPLGVFWASSESPVGSVVGRVSAYDPDSYEDSGLGISYSISKGECSDLFSIDSNTGAISLQRRLWPTPHLTPQWPISYGIIVNCRDSGGRTNSTLATVSLNPGPGAVFASLPFFRTPKIVTSVFENTAPGTVIASLQNFVDESSLDVPVLFSLDAGNVGIFGVDAQSGALVTLQSLDREEQDLYRVVVQIAGSDGLPSHLPHAAEVEIHVLDVNDNMPRVHPVWLEGTISESASPDSPILGASDGLPLVINCEDGDSGLAGQPLFRFVGPQADLHENLFYIDSHTGILRLKERLDREVIAEYVLSIEISDMGEPVPLIFDDLLVVRVRVDDVNDSPPEFLPDVNPTVARVMLPSYAGAEIARFHAVDPDLNDDVTYHIADGDGRGFFTIENTTGILRVSEHLESSASIDRRQFTLQIKAKDNSSIHTVTHNISVFVHVLDTSKMFVIEPRGGLDVRLVEHFSNNGVPQFLAQFHIQNALPGRVFSFELANTSTRAFKIDRHTGVLHATGDPAASDELDREVTPVLTLWVVAHEHSSSLRSPQRFGEAFVRVHLEDINDHAPQFIGLPYHATFCAKDVAQLPLYPEAGGKHPQKASPRIMSLLREACQSNYFNVTATDEDAGVNGEVAYRVMSIHPHTEPPLLSVDPMTGRLSLVQAVPGDWAGRRLRAIIRATDGGQRSTDAVVEVELSASLGPRFTASHYVAEISEDVDLGHAVITVEAYSASGSTLLYRLVAHGFEETLIDSPFVLDYKTGIVRVGSPLDFENKNYHKLLVEVLDPMTGLVSHVDVYVNVTDINDVRPKFASPIYRASISESADVGSVVELEPLSLATDDDSGVNGEIRYYLHPLTAPELMLSDPRWLRRGSVGGFNVDSSTGRLWITEKLDFEKQSRLTFWIVALDGGSPGMAGRSLVELSILDANDNPPRFDQDGGPSESLSSKCRRTVAISDDTPTDSFVLRLMASDADVNDSLVYRLVCGSGSDAMFRLDSRNGSLYWRPPQTPEGRAQLTRALVAYEAGQRGSGGLLFEVEVSDGIHTTTCQVHVDVIPTNRHAPEFPRTTQTISVAENLSIGGLVARLEPAVDDDTGQFGRISYRLIGDTDTFSLDPKSGELTLAGPLDHETRKHYSLTVMAADSGGLSDFKVVEIAVTDVNDNAPSIEQIRYEITLLPCEYNEDAWETSPSNNQLPVPLRIVAHDADEGPNGQVVYRLFGPQANATLPFDVDFQTGDVLLRHPLNGSQNNFGFFVHACDQPLDGRPLCSEPVGVTINLAKSKLQLSTPRITCSSVSVPEGKRDLGVAVARCQVDDAHERGTWSLIGGSQNVMRLFKVDASTGAIHANKELDYEVHQWHNLSVQYREAPREDTKHTPLIAVTQVEIEVGDVNDCTPKFCTSPMPQLILPETVVPGKRVFRMPASDCDSSDSGLLMYGLSETADFKSETRDTHFQIDSRGWITVVSPLNREETQSYDLTVTVTDAAGHVSVDSLKISLIDSNDNPPEWKDGLAEAAVNITENELSLGSIFTLEVTDKDSSSDPSLLRFYEVGGSSHQFTLSPRGDVYLHGPLDAEAADRYVLQIKAHDGLHESVQPFRLTLNVNDVNDNSPICHLPDRDIVALESTAPRTILCSLNATDADISDVNSALFYHLQEDPENRDLFNVNITTGLVRLSNYLDYELRKHHTLTVEVKDRGGRACRYHLQVRVLDTNDNPPIFDHPIEIAPVPESAPVGSLVGKIHASDLDSVDSNALEYSLVAPRNTSFSVDKHSGILRVIQPLDREALDVHEIVVAVTDGAAQRTPGSAKKQPPRHTSTTTVTIHLLDVNDSPPQFIDPRPQASISEITPVGSLVMKLEAISLDEGDNAVVRYRLLENQPEFTLNSSTGELLLGGALDYERTPRYFLTVEAKDGGNPPLSSTTVATINVVDVNDNKPHFLGQGASASNSDNRGVFYFEIFENSPIGTQIGRITATDSDSGENGRLLYAFCDASAQPNVTLTYPGSPTAPRPAMLPAIASLFHLGESQGELSLLFRPDRERVSEYRFSVCVSDHGETPQSAVTDVFVTIRDTNDYQPQFEHSNYEFFVQVDRSGNVVSTNSFVDLQQAFSPNPGEILLGQLAITDLDASPNAGPFMCKLSGINQPSSPPHWAGSSANFNQSTSLFSVRALHSVLPDSDINHQPQPPPAFIGLEPNQTGYCSIYTVSNLPLGTKSLVVRAHDSGMTALHSAVTITVHVSRQSDLPPEIVSSNTTLVVYRGSCATDLSMKPRFDLDGLTSPTTSAAADKQKASHDITLVQVSVRDRTTYDRLFFELLPDAASAHFTIDQYGGSIKVRPFAEPSPPAHPSLVPNHQIDQSVAWLLPTLPRLHPLAQLNSGLYELRVKVTNASLSANGSLYIKVASVTDEMLESACVLHISEISPNELFIQHLDTSIRMELATSLLRGSLAGDDGREHVFILSVQASVQFGQRQKRSAVGSGVDLLVSVYDPLERHFIESGHLVQRIHALQSNLSKLVGHQIHAYNSLCAQKKCESGSCATRVVLDAEAPPNVFEVHGVSHATPRFSLLATCRCPANFGGTACDRPRNACASVACKAPRVCVPSTLLPGAHACVCAPPWTGNNCEVLNRPLGDARACFSETCFKQREFGPLQFTGASFVHWQMAKPSEHRLEISFTVRTRQQSGPLFSVKWNALRAFKIHLIDDGYLAIAPVDFASGSTDSDWLVSRNVRLSDAQWHRVKFALFATASEGHESSIFGLQWWTELVIDGTHSFSQTIDWDTGDAEMQEFLLGADPVQGFQTLTEAFETWIPAEQDEAFDLAWPSFNRSAPLGLLRSGFIGCIKDVTVNRVKPPYQVGLTPQQAVLLSRQHLIAAPGAFIDIPNSLPILQVVQVQNIDYQCSAGSTFDSSCAYAPCQYGGSCTSHRALTYSRIDRGPSGIDASQYSCKCQRGFRGPRCEVVLDLCALKPCQNGASCEVFNVPQERTDTSSSAAAYRCVCRSGFTGPHCEILAPKSSSSSANSTGVCAHAEALAAGTPLCLHDARCFDAPSGPVCGCGVGWVGARCEHDLNECLLAAKALSEDEHSSSTKDPLCNPYGSRRGFCVNLPGSYQCNCSLGYAGRHCQIRNLTPLKPDSNALGLTPMHGYIIASIFALVFLLAVITVVILTCCFRRRSPQNANFYGRRNDGQTNSSFFPWDKTLGNSHQTKEKHLLESVRMLPDGGDGSRSALEGSMILDPGRQVMSPDLRRQSYLVDENGRLMILRPGSVISGAGDPVQMVYLANSGVGGVSSVPTVGYVPASSTMVRRSYVEAPLQPGQKRFGSPVGTVVHPQHLSQIHLTRAVGMSSNTLASDRISLGSGSDRFSVQSGGGHPRLVVATTASGKMPQTAVPTSTQPSVFYVYPQTAACVRRSQVLQPLQMSVPPEGAVFYHRPSGSSVGNLSASGRRLSLFGIPETESNQHHLFPVNGDPDNNQPRHPESSMRAATSMNLFGGRGGGTRLITASPPTVQSQPYWAESTLSLLPPIPPASQPSQQEHHLSVTTNVQNGRPSLYRKAMHSYASNADLRRSNRISRQRNGPAADGTSQPHIPRPQSVCSPLLESSAAVTSPSGSGEACVDDTTNDLGSLRWEHQNESSPLSAFAIAEPRGIQQFQTLKRHPIPSFEDYQSPHHPESTMESSNSVDTLTAPSGATTDSPSRLDGALKTYPRGSVDGEGSAAVIFKGNGLTPRPLPPNIPLANGAGLLRQAPQINSKESDYVRDPLSETIVDTPVNTLKRQNL